MDKNVGNYSVGITFTNNELATVLTNYVIYIEVRKENGSMI